jgi:hypothetical protein
LQGLHHAEAAAANVGGSCWALYSLACKLGSSLKPQWANTSPEAKQSITLRKGFPY